MSTHALDDYELGTALGWSWAAGVLFSGGYQGLPIGHGDLDRLARSVLDSIPGFAADEVQRSPRLLDGLKEALTEADGDGVICLSSADLVQSG